MANCEKNAPFNSLDGVKWPYKKKLLQFFFFQKRKINRWYDRAGPHTKLTKIYDTTYYINVHKQFVKNTLLSIENMFEGARSRVYVKDFFLLLSFTWFNLIYPSSISLFMYSVWFQFEWYLMMPHHALVYPITK